LFRRSHQQWRGWDIKEEVRQIEIHSVPMPSDMRVTGNFEWYHLNRGENALDCYISTKKIKSSKLVLSSKIEDCFHLVGLVQVRAAERRAGRTIVIDKTGMIGWPI